MPFPSVDLIIDIPNLRVDLNASVSDSTFYTVVDLYSLIQDLFDEQSAISLPGAMRLKVPMRSRGQFDYGFTNKWYGTQRLIKHLKGASVFSEGYTNEIHRLSFASSGYTNAIASDIGKTVVSGSNTGKLVDFDNARRVWKVRSSSVWGNSLAVSITAGAGAGTTLSSAGAVTGEELHSNFYTVGDTVSGNKYFFLGGQIYDGTGWFGSGNSGAGNIHLDVLATVKEAGILIGGGIPRVFSRNEFEFFDWAEADIGGGGRTPIPLATQLDGENTTPYNTIKNSIDTSQGGTGTASQIKIDFGSYTADVNADGTNEPYEARLDVDGQTLKVAYEAAKYLVSRANSAITIDGVPASVYVAADNAYAPIKSAPLGSFAGGKFFGGRGLYPVNLIANDASNYQVITSAGVSVNPPTFVTCLVSGLQPGLKVSAFRALSVDPASVDPSLYTLAAGNNSGNSVLIVQQAIASDTPSSGVVRIVNPATQNEDSYNYSNYNRATKTFTLTSPLTRNYSNSETAYIGYLDTVATGSTVSVAVQLDPARVGDNVVINVRKGSGVFKMIPFTISTPFTETGFSVPATVVEDPVNTNS